MTSAVGGNPLPESLSGPCRLLRYHELNTHKVTKSQSFVGALGVCCIMNKRNLLSHKVTNQRAVRGHTRGSTGAIPGASRVALRAAHRMTVSGRRQDERPGRCSRTVQGVACHYADEDKEDEQQRAVWGQHMVQVVCRQAV